jgi:hypothetical protein
MREISVSQCTLIYFVAFGMGSEGNVPKNGNTTFGFSFTTMLQHNGQIWSRTVWERAI